jgi:Spy/CpxP family protein refolding chaperone
VRKAIAGLLLAGALAAAPSPAPAQGSGEGASEADIVRALRAKEAEIGPEKQAFVEDKLNLTAEQLAAFRPVYAEFQEALKRFNQRRLDNVIAYSRAYNSRKLTDEQAHALALEALAIEREENYELEMVYGKARTVLPPKKAVTYLHIESKLRTLVRFKQTSAVPLAEGL